MRGRGGVIAGAAKLRQAAWDEPIRSDGQQKHARYIWQAKFGNGSMGSGPSGHKATPRALLARALADRAGVALTVATRQAAAVARRVSPPKVIWPGPLAAADRHFYA